METIDINEKNFVMLLNTMEGDCTKKYYPEWQ